MLVKCICTNCATHLEFEKENAGEKIDCPHCGFETTLFLPGQEPNDPVIEELTRKARRKKFLIIGGSTLLVVGGVGAGLYFWALPLVRGVLPESAGVVIPILLLVGACLLIPLVLFWMIFPVLLFLQLRTLNGHLATIEMNLRPVVSAEIPTAEEVPAEAETDSRVELVSETEQVQRD
jgi:hypothetical protein